MKNIVMICYMLALGILFCYWGWYNCYPFVYSDTGTYIDSGFQFYVPNDRPITYGLFCRHSSMAESLYWVMIAQGLITVLFIKWWVNRFFPAVSTPLGLASICVFLISCTTASIYASYILPDFLTPVYFGSLILILLNNGSFRSVLPILLVAVFAQMCHNSHLASGLIFASIIIIGRVFWNKRLQFSWKNVLTVLGVVLSGWIGIYLLNYSIDKKWDFAPAGHAFTLARLHEMGLVQRYINDHCNNSNNLYWCTQKDSLTEDLLWDPKSPQNKNGGWDAHRAEDERMINEILTTPAYLRRYIIEAVNGTIRQFFYFRAEKTTVLREDSPPYNAVKKHFPQELIAYKISHQNHRTYYLDFEGLNTRQLYLFFFSLLILLATFINRNQEQVVESRSVFAFRLVFMALLINAAVCATLSTVVSRYQGRIVWLFILTGILLFVSNNRALLSKYAFRL